MKRTAGLLAAVWIVLGPILAITIAWQFAFTDSYIGVSLAAAIIVAPPIVIAALLYRDWGKSNV